MATYRLRHRPEGAADAIEREFEAHDDTAALVLAGRLVAESRGMPGAWVSIDEAAGRITVGAGYRSHRGSFALERPAAMRPAR